MERETVFSDATGQSDGGEGRREREREREGLCSETLQVSQMGERDGERERRTVFRDTTGQSDGGEGWKEREREKDCVQ